MSEEQKFPSIGEQTKNLAKFSLDLIKYIQKNFGEKSFLVSDEVYNQRMEICKQCKSYCESEERCMECGCYLPAKAKVILDSCPLQKWDADSDSWENTFEGILSDMNEEQKDT